MLTWTFDTTAGTLNSYFDGAVVDTFNSAAANFNMIDSSSPVGTFGVKGDSSNFINGTIALDEAWVFNGALAAEQVANLYNCNDLTGNSCPLTKLRATVNTTNGQVVIDNPLEAGVTFNSYLLGSADSSLDSSGWSAIANQSVSGFPAGNGDGNGWEKGSGPNSKQVAEYRLIGDSTLHPVPALILAMPTTRPWTRRTCCSNTRLKAAALSTATYSMWNRPVSPATTAAMASSTRRTTRLA